MNLGKWNAFYLALTIKDEYPDGISLTKLRNLIERTCGTDKRTIDKYLDVLRVNKYLLDSPNANSTFIANPDVENMKPLTPKQLYEKRVRERKIFSS